MRHWKLILGALGALLVLGAGGAMLLKIGDQRRALVAEEAGRLRAEGHVVAEQARGSDLHAANQELEQTVQHLLDTEPGSRVVERLVIRTAPGTIAPPPDADTSSSAAPSPTAAAGSQPTAGGPPCSVYAGEQGDIRIEAVRLDTQKGNRVLKARAAFWRVFPKPEFKVYEGEADVNVSQYFTTEGAPAAPRVTRWAASAGYGTDGITIGAERRLIGPAWVGLEASRGRAAVRLRVEF